jgi:pyroglutamyl-peptidase
MIPGEMTVLVTGFEPFGGADVNPSELLVRALAARGEAGLVAEVLPTSYRRAGHRVAELIRGHRPDAILLTGLAGSAPCLRLEQVALNLNNYASPDNDGDVRQRRQIAVSGPVGYWSTLPLDAMAEVAGRLEEPVEFSHDAGGYVCNHVFFTAMHTVTAEGPAARCGFIHLPPIPGPGRRLDRVVDVLSAWIRMPELAPDVTDRGAQRASEMP